MLRTLSGFLQFLPLPHGSSLCSVGRFPSPRPESFRDSVTVSRHQPSRCPFFACLRVATGYGHYLIDFLMVWPCVVPSRSDRFVLEKITKRLRGNSTHSQPSALVPHAPRLPPLLHTQAAREACLAGCVPLRCATFHTSASQPFGSRLFFL